VSAIEVDIGVDGARSEIKVERRRGHEGSAEDSSGVHCLRHTLCGL